MLQGMRVLEVARASQAVAYGGLVLARLGADVIKVEPPTGDRARRTGPFPRHEPGLDASAAFLYANRGKRGATLDLEHPSAPWLLGRLVAASGVLLDDLDAADRARLGLAPEALQGRSLIHVGVRPFGDYGDWAGRRGTALVSAHAGGESFINPSGLEHLDRPPLKLAGHTQEYDAGVVAAIAVLAGLYEGSDGYRYLDLSEQDVVATMIRPEIVTAFVTGLTENRATRVHEFGGPLPCADGWVHVVIREAAQWDGLVKLMGGPDWATDPRYRTREARYRDGFMLTQQMAGWLLTQYRHELMARAQAIGVPITAVETPADVLASAQLDGRDYWEPVDAGGAGYRAPSPLAARIADVPAGFGHAPALGEHNVAVYRELAGLSAEELQVAVQTGLIHGQYQHADARHLAPSPQPPDNKGATARAQVHAPSLAEAGGPRGPLAGVRVVELASVWAGPCAGMFLGLLGASVVKVESRAFPDLTRRNAPDMHSSPTFHLANLGKRSIELDVSSEKGLEAFLALCSASDIVVTNVQPESLTRKNAGYDQCRMRNPRLIWAQISTSGSTGPERHYAGYAPSFNALSGLSSLSGYEDGPPAEMRSAGDMRVAYDLVLSCLAALLKRRLTGEGVFLDLSCREVLTARIGDRLIGYQMDGRAESIGNAQMGVCPRGVYPCRDDGWLALEVTNEDEWYRLARLVPGLSNRSERNDPLGRWHERDAVDRQISAWTRERSAAESADALQAEGIAAAPSMPNTALGALPHLWQRRLFFDMRGDRQGGPDRLVATPWGSPANRWPSFDAAFSERPCGAPRLGQDTEEVLTDVRGTETVVRRATRAAG